MEPIRFAIVGGGWRALFYLRIARALPERFAVTGLLARDAAKGAALEAKWSVATCRTLDELLASKPAFVVTSVPWPINPGLLRELADRGVPALSETPPAPDLEGLIALHDLTRGGARLQVAEQYQFQPLHAARIALARSGKLGTVTQAQVSVCHGYHGLNLLRQLLGVQFEAATIRARNFASPLVEGPGRDGPPAAESVRPSGQKIAWLDFGDKLGVFDFSGDQYFSWVRSPRVLVRGERGEINNHTVRYLQDFQTPITLELLRHDAGHDGNLEGYYHKGITAGAEWVYVNPVAPGSLADDEIAIADCLVRMAEYVDGGPGFCSLAEASQDHYLGMMVDRAAAEGVEVRALPQVWAH
jgi:predicted dehydrogenase